MIHSKNIIEETLLANNHEDRTFDLAKHHLSIKKLDEGDGHILKVKNLEFTEVKRMIEEGIDIFFDMSHEYPNKVLKPVDLEFLTSEDFAIMQNTRKEIYHIRNKQKNAYVNSNVVHGLVITHVTTVPKIINWLSNNK